MRPILLHYAFDDLTIFVSRTGTADRILEAKEKEREKDKGKGKEKARKKAKR